jgi:3-methyladenine DNA glycosylase AlkD
MQAYMKSTMPYYGVTTVPMRAICRDLLKTHSPTRDDILTLWRQARFREERYVALELSGKHPALDMLAMYEEFVVSGAWWDLVDPVATHHLAALVRMHPDVLKPLMRDWSRDGNLWKRRSAIICQVTFKRDTDLDLLYACIEPNLTDKSFWLRKAIGWALRSLAWTDPDEVRRYVAEHDAQLSGLSKREALKNL